MATEKTDPRPPYPVTDAAARAADDLADLGARFALVGGLAVSVWGEPRYTRDVDLAVAVGRDEDAERLIHGLTRRGYELVTVIEQTKTGRLATARPTAPSSISSATRTHRSKLRTRPRRRAARLRARSRRDEARGDRDAWGIRRDFWDAFVMAKNGLSLAQMAADFRTKFGNEASDLYHVLRALTYFGDAEADPLFPRGMTKMLWEEVRRYFETEGPRLLQQLTRRP